MKKIIALITIIICAFTCTIFFGAKIVNAEETIESEPTTESEPSEAITYPCKVISSIGDGGNALFDIEEGNVGDLVTAYIKPDFLFVVESIQINGASVAISSDNKYQFNLVEGENIVSATFVISNEKLTEISNLIKGVEENGISSIFTVSNLLTFVSWAISLFLSSGFFITLIRNKKIKSQTIEQVSNTVVETLESNNAQILKEFITNLIGPSLETITTKMDGMDDCIKVFCRCFVLAQDDTPENRLAIIEELTKLNNNDEALTKQIRSIVKEEQAAQEAKIEETNKAIEALKESNAKLTETTSSTSENASAEDSYGQL